MPIPLLGESQLISAFWQENVKSERSETVLWNPETRFRRVSAHFHPAGRFILDIGIFDAPPVHL